MKFSAKFRAIAVTYAGVLLMSSSAAALAADKLDIGKDEYDSACAVCHGITGKGDGSLKLLLVKRVPDLTVLAKNNNGVFPFDRVYQIIDGRQEQDILSHGSREMPVWGRTFNNKGSIYFKEYPPYNSEYTVRSRILALIEYLNRLQE